MEEMMLTIEELQKEQEREKIENVEGRTIIRVNENESQ